VSPGRPYDSKRVFELNPPAWEAEESDSEPGFRGEVSISSVSNNREMNGLLSKIGLKSQKYLRSIKRLIMLHLVLLVHNL
jgi:hypothetical protein